MGSVEMDRVAVDTSVVVAALLSWHEHHDRALAVLTAARNSSHGVILPLPVLVETYAVLTRLPPPSRLGPNLAWRLIEAVLAEHTAVPALDGAAALGMVAALSKAGIAGGATYDAHVLACAKQGGAARLATFNGRHFERLDLGDMELVVP